MGATTEVITNFVPQRPKTPAFKVFHSKFLCLMSQMHLVSSEYLEQGGWPTSGDAKIDRTMAEQKIQVQLTIAAMAMYHADGVPFQIYNPPDSARIYQYLYDHLSDWKQQIQMNPGTVDAPIEDLRKFDALAAEVYRYARFYLRDTMPFHGTLFNSINALAHSRGFSRGLPPKQSEEKPAAAHNPLPEKHTPMAESMAKTVAERKKSWR